MAGVRTMVLLLALAHGALVAASEPPSATRTAATTEPAAPPVSARGPEPEPGGKVTASQIALGALGVGLLEGLFALYSAWAAASPQGAGWTIVILSPIAAGSGSSENAAAGVGFAAGGAGLGLYNAFELRSSKYSRTERFWRNMAGWHAALGCGLISGWIFDPSKVAIAVAPGPDGPLLLVSGRF